MGDRTRLFDHGPKGRTKPFVDDWKAPLHGHDRAVVLTPYHLSLGPMAGDMGVSVPEPSGSDDYKLHYRLRLTLIGHSAENWRVDSEWQPAWGVARRGRERPAQEKMCTHRSDK